MPPVISLLIPAVVPVHSLGMNSTSVLPVDALDEFGWIFSEDLLRRETFSPCKAILFWHDLFLALINPSSD